MNQMNDMDIVTATIQVGQSPHGLAMTSDGREVLAAVFGDSQVDIIDAASDQVVGQVPVGNPHNIAISPDGKTAYVTAQQPGATALAVIDLTGPSQIGSVPLDKTPRVLSFRPDGARLYFTEASSDAVQVLDPATNTVVDQIAVGASPQATMSGDSAASVSIQGFAFTPQAATAMLGQTITWTNMDSVTHTITGDDGMWDSGPVAPGQSFSIVLDQPGSYAYHCSIRPFMQGTVTIDG